MWLVKSILVLAALALSAPAGLAGSIRSVEAPAPVLAVASDGTRVAYATGRSETDCNRVFVWNLATRGVSKLGSKTHCEQTSTGNVVAAVSIAGTRVLWTHAVGGNSRQWTLWTATTSRPSPKRLRLANRDADAVPPIVIGSSRSTRAGDLSRGILPYAVDRSVIGLRPDGARKYAWSAPARVVALSALDGRVAVALEGGRVIVLAEDGRILRTETFTRTAVAVRLTRSGVFVQSGRSLELREGGSVQTYDLLPGVRLADANEEHAILVGGGRVLRLELASGRSGVVTKGTLAALGGTRVAGATGRRVGLYPLP